jgi:excisionase family DNA binding protein
MECINYTPQQCAKVIGISERTLWTLTKAGKIPHKQIGNRTYYPIDAIKAWNELEAIQWRMNNGHSK